MWMDMLAKLLKDYKDKLDEREQFVHPMLYEDALEIGRRALDKEEQLMRDLKELKEKMEE
jgi:hypothetical protein